MPQQNLIPRNTGLSPLRVLRVTTPTEYIMPANRVIDADQHIPVPFTTEHTFNDPPLIARVFIHRTPSLGRPADNFDIQAVRISHQFTIAFDRVRVSCDQGYRMQGQRRFAGRIEQILWMVTHCAGPEVFLQSR